MAANPFFPTMTHFALALHATREELVALAAHELAASGVPMLAATGPAVFEFDDLA